MLAEKKTATNIGVGAGIGLEFVGVALVLSGRPLLSVLALPIGLASMVFFGWGCWSYAAGKGYPGVLGLIGLFFSLLGLLILVLLPDKYKDGRPAVALEAYQPAPYPAQPMAPTYGADPPPFSPAFAGATAGGSIGGLAAAGGAGSATGTTPSRPRGPRWAATARRAGTKVRTSSRCLNPSLHPKPQRRPSRGHHQLRRRSKSRRRNPLRPRATSFRPSRRITATASPRPCDRRRPPRTTGRCSNPRDSEPTPRRQRRQAAAGSSEDLGSAPHGPSAARHRGSKVRPIARRPTAQAATANATPDAPTTSAICVGVQSLRKCVRPPAIST